MKKSSKELKNADFSRHNSYCVVEKDNDYKGKKKKKFNFLKIRKHKKPINLHRLKCLCIAMEDESNYDEETVTSDVNSITQNAKRNDIKILIKSAPEKFTNNHTSNFWKNEKRILKNTKTYEILKSDDTCIEKKKVEKKKKMNNDRCLTCNGIFCYNRIRKKKKKKKKKKRKKEEIEEEEPRWKSKIDYVKSILSYSLKLGVIWRFPYVCHVNGGGTFLFSYLICLLLLGFPLLLLEMTIGQKYQKSFIYCFKELCEKLIGVVISSILITTLCIIYFYTISTWTLLYFFKSFHFFLNWENEGINKADAAKRFFLNNILNKSQSLTDFHYNRTNLYLLICASIIFIILIFCLVNKKRKHNDKSVAVVELLQSIPIISFLRYKEICMYFLLILLVFRTISLDGAIEGIKYYVNIDFKKLQNGTIWVAAGSQILYSLGLAWGDMINYGSKNNKKNNFVKDGFNIMISNMSISFLAGFIVFSVLGFMAKVSNMNIEDVGKFSLGFPFVAYSIGITETSNFSFFSIFFFGMFFIICIESLVLMIDMVIKTIIDLLNIKDKDDGSENEKKKKHIITFVCFFLFCFNTFLTSPPGSYLVEIIDFITGIATIYVLAFCEIYALLNYYGIKNFIHDIYYMTNIKLPFFITYIYFWIIPLVLIALFFVSICLLIIPQHEYESGKNKKNADESGKEETVCLNKENCNDNGVCEEGLCICDIGWQGEKCEAPYYTVETMVPLNLSTEETQENSENIIGNGDKNKNKNNNTGEKAINITRKGNETDSSFKEQMATSNVPVEDDVKSEGAIETSDLFIKHDVKLIEQANFDFNVHDDNRTNYSLIPLNEWKLILKKYYQENNRRFIYQNDNRQTEEEAKEVIEQNDTTDAGNDTNILNSDDIKDSLKVGETISKNIKTEKKKMLKGGGIQQKSISQVELNEKEYTNKENSLSQIDLNNFYYKSFTYDNALITPLVTCPYSCNMKSGKGMCINKIFKERGFYKNNLKHIQNADVSDDPFIFHYDNLEFYETTKVAQIGDVEIHDFSGKCLCDVEFSGKACSEHKYVIGYSLFIFIGWCFVFVTLLPIPIIFFFRKARNMFIKFLNINRNMNRRKKVSSAITGERHGRLKKMEKCNHFDEHDWKFSQKGIKKNVFQSYEGIIPKESLNIYESKKKRCGRIKVRKRISEKISSEETNLLCLPNWGFHAVSKRKGKTKGINKSRMNILQKDVRDIKLGILKKKYNPLKNVLSKATKKNYYSSKIPKSNYFLIRNKDLKKKKYKVYSQLQEVNIDSNEKEHAESIISCESSILEIP